MANSSTILLMVLALATTSLAGCSRGNSIDRDQVRSAIWSARSLAAESEIFIEFVLQGRAMRRYAEGHAAYLQDEAVQLAKDLENAVAESGVADSVRACRTQLGQIINELSGIRAAIGDRDRLVAAKARMKQIRESLEKANPHP